MEKDLPRKSCMKELMACDDGKQNVDGHKHSTSTFIIRISDGINFCNQY
jgi:hypothetical protein